MATLLAACGGSDRGLDVAVRQASTQAPVAEGMKRALAAAPAASGGVMINEVNAGNWKGAVDEDGESEDWVELYNPGTAAVDLTGYELSNKTASRFFWTFPAGTQVPAKGYLTVWLSKKDRAVPGRPLHANFDLDSGADTVYLSASNATVSGILVDGATPPLVKSDQSWCRMPSGVASAPFMVCNSRSRNTANAGASYPGILAKPTLSLRSGFYAAAQTVTLSGPAGAALRYTTDGSEPTAASAAYTAPLPITASRVIRVAAFAPGAATSLVETGTYVISAGEAAKYASLKAIMVAMSPADLVQFQANNQDVFFRASFELITGGSNSVFRMDAEGKAGGNAGSADSPVRVMNVTARDTFGPKALPTPLLWPDKPGVTSAKKFRLRSGSNDWDEAHLRDQLAQRVSADGPNVIASSTAVAMFINGRYYGLMDLREREDETLLANNLGVDKNWVDYIQETTGAPEVKNGGAAALAGYQAMLDYVTRNDMSRAANYAVAKTLLNPESLAYDWALHMFQANCDWPYHNIDLWRSPQVDGRWTWRPHDMDWSFGIYRTPASYNMNSSFTQTGSALIAALLRNTEFRNLYLNAVADQMNVMTPAFQKATLDGMANELRPYIPDNHAALGLGTVANWEPSSASSATGWMPARPSTTATTAASSGWRRARPCRCR
jgi:CotH kinase protein/Lamin Tail Domain/Chitobiase/beta-hexosaminidase C-terminal domain